MLALFFEGCAYHERCDLFWAGTFKSLLVYHSYFWNLKRDSNLDLNLGSVPYLENTPKGRFAQENIFLALTLPLTSSQGHRQDS